MNVPFIDFSQQYQTIKDKIDVGLKDVFEKGCFILGQPEKDFEEQFAKYCESQYAIGVNSGTDALYLALASLDLKPGDEVILPSFTFIATALAVSYTGATPVFADVDDVSYNMDPKAFQKAITEKTKAVLVVHLYGQCADMDEINAIAKEKGIIVIEDAAQAHGSSYKGKRVGSLGDIACFSFYPTKSLGGFGDGGMIVTKDEKTCKKAQMLRDYGREGRYEHIIKGFNSRLDTVQAIILAAKLPYLDQWNKMRTQMGDLYCELLKDLPGIIAPKTKEERVHIYQTFAIRILDGKRDEVLEKMKDKGIGVLIHYPIPVHLQKAYADAGYKKGDLPVSEKLADEVLSLPMFPHISKEQVAYVASSLKEIVGEVCKV